MYGANYFDDQQSGCICMGVADDRVASWNTSDHDRSDRRYPEEIGTAIKLSCDKGYRGRKVKSASLEHWQLHLHLLLEPVTLLVWELPFIWEAQVQFSGAG